MSLLFATRIRSSGAILSVLPILFLKPFPRVRKRRDYIVKLGKYEAAGVKEYWIVDPFEKRVLVYFLEEKESTPTIYPLDADIPVNIYGGKLVLKFQQIALWADQESTFIN